MLLMCDCSVGGIWGLIRKEIKRCFLWISVGGVVFIFSKIYLSKKIVIVEKGYYINSIIKGLLGGCNNYN